ncbi:MAG: B-box zinc finger protein [Actinomycetota bacterium]
MEAEERIRRTAEGAVDTGTGGPDGAAERPGRTGEADGHATHERCAHHPGRAAVARCSVCDEPICLACAVPVRGRVLGPGCLATELGDPALVATPNPAPAPAGSWGAVAGAVLAVAATVAPWTRTGAGDRLFGAWVPSLRWSMLAAVAAVALLPAAWWLRARGSRNASLLLMIVGTAVAVGSALAIAFPPTFQAAAWGPWLALAGGAIATIGAIANAVIERRPGQGV